MVGGGGGGAAVVIDAEEGASINNLLRDWPSTKERIPLYCTFLSQEDQVIIRGEPDQAGNFYAELFSLQKS